MIEIHHITVGNKPELVLESANMILGRVKMVNFNGPYILLSDRMKEHLDTTVPLTHNLPKTEAEKIAKYEIGPGH